MAIADPYAEMISLPRALRFPVELRPPQGFDPERLDSWPVVPGRLEFVDGRLLYMPPCGDVQQDTVTDIVIALGSWVRSHAGFVLGTNEAGMRLGTATRAADAAVWRRADLGRHSGGLRRVAPLLAVEVSSEDEPEALLRDKARWYLDQGVRVVWLVLTAAREVIVMASGSETRCRMGDRITRHPDLPDLEPAVAEFFIQIEAWRQGGE